MPNSVSLPFVNFDIATEEEIDIYVNFTGHYRNTSHVEDQFKVLNAIQYVAVLMDHSDEYISRKLVEMGLRAPRYAFPMDFQSYFDRAMERIGQKIGAPSPEMLELFDHWNGLSSPMHDISEPRQYVESGSAQVA